MQKHERAADVFDIGGVNARACQYMTIACDVRPEWRAHIPAVVHVDQAANDFNTLFDVLDHDPERYSVDDPNIFPSAVGRSFYERVLPSEYVHLGWSSYAAVW